ncbi:uncharacterized protein LOC116132862 [Pistacia vera]|uniref:uncharacterized protein LOC116132862 n=1 Tax=Pistacia vera TaxID=55513 RepID=UPI001263041F|nr:uncharacterized protein LOC116132862 [Pistacia vera]XP_031274400.1 uncharacterized protein LOC116132862 [Pistacia vera]
MTEAETNAKNTEEEICRLKTLEERNGRFNNLASDIEKDNDCEEIEDTRSAEEVCEPKPRMIFDSLDIFVEYYRTYENKMGFEVIIRSSKKEYDGEVKNVTLACSCSGKLSSNP